MIANNKLVKPLGPQDEEYLISLIDSFDKKKNFVLDRYVDSDRVDYINIYNYIELYDSYFDIVVNKNILCAFEDINQELPNLVITSFNGRVKIYNLADRLMEVFI